MIATALSRLSNDRTNERTAARVSAGAIVFALCIIYSCLCFSGLSHHCLRVVLRSMFSPLLSPTIPSSLPLSFISRKVSCLMEDACDPRGTMTIISLADYRGGRLAPTVLLQYFSALYSPTNSLPLPPFSASLPSVCHSRSNSLIPPSTSCWCLLIAVMLMWTD